MTSKERIKAAVNFKPTDRVPSVFFDGGVWLSARNKISLQNMLDMENCGADLLLDLYSKIDTDVVFTGNGLIAAPFRAIGGTVDFSVVGASGSAAPILKDISDIRNFNKKDIRRQFESSKEVNAMFRQMEIIHKAYGDTKFIGSGGGCPFTVAGQMLGVQKMMELLFDEDDMIKDLFEYATALVIEGTNMFIEHGGEFICMADPVASGDLISQSMFEELALPLEKITFEELKGAEVKMLHICGNTKSRIESLKELDIDAFSLDSVDLKTAMDLADGKFAIFGNLNPVRVLENMSAEEISNISKDLCRTAGKNGGFILSSGCDLTPNTPFENVVAMLDAPKYV